jgi:hypothetical protein
VTDEERETHMRYLDSLTPDQLVTEYRRACLTYEEMARRLDLVQFSRDLEDGIDIDGTIAGLLGDADA